MLHDVLRFLTMGKNSMSNILSISNHAIIQLDKKTKPGTCNSILDRLIKSPYLNI